MKNRKNLLKKLNITVEICKIYCFCYYCILLFYLIEYKKQKKNFAENSVLPPVPVGKKCIIHRKELSYLLF